MLYFIIPVVVPILIYWLLPSGLKHITNRKFKRNTTLRIACFVYFISWFLPSPLIEGKDTSFITHLVGGGVFCGLLWLYSKNQLWWQASPVIEFASLYALVCTLGVSNELFEWLIARLGLVKELNGADTWWDLLANTIGMLIFFSFYAIGLRKKMDSH